MAPLVRQSLACPQTRLRLRRRWRPRVGQRLRRRRLTAGGRAP